AETGRSLGRGRGVGADHHASPALEAQEDRMSPHPLLDRTRSKTRSKRAVSGRAATDAAGNPQGLPGAEVTLLAEPVGDAQARHAHLVALGDVRERLPALDPGGEHGGTNASPPDRPVGD